ncbi:MAG: aldo/keto reductase [Deltaproteobacteria bacterium]|nr:aldo/keto reductase [Deltaproteobacteria bacterium]
MEQRQMGDSSLVCSTVGFGTWEIGKTQYGDIDEKEATEAVHYALDHGITLFDTAEGYGPGHSEVLLGKALGSRRKDTVLVTKVGLLFDENGKLSGLDASYDHILGATEGCLKRLGTDWIDLLLIHWPDHKTPAAETIEALERLKEDGKIREYGVSNYNVRMMEDCEQHGHLAANQVGYHMFDRRMEKEVLRWCADKKIGFMAYGTLAYGLLTGAFTPETTFVDWDWRSKGKAFGIPLFEREHFLKELKVVDRLKALATQHDKSVAQLAIAWVLDNQAVCTALVGVRKPSEILENIEAAGWRLTDDIKREIDRIFEQEGVSTYRDAEQMLVPPALQQ